MSYTISYVRCRIRYRTSNVRYRTSDVRYRIRYHKKCRRRRFFYCSCQSYVATSYTISYTICTSDVRYRIRYRKKCRRRRFFYCSCQSYVATSYTMSYVISMFLQKSYTICTCEHRYYTISYVYIVRYIGIIRYRTSKSSITYDDTVRPRMRY